MTQPEPEKALVEGLMVYVDWSGVVGTPTDHVNQFITQIGPPNLDGSPDGVYLTFGHLAPPLIVSRDPEMQAREIEAAKAGVAVEIRGRFHLSRERLGELIKVLEETAQNYDAATSSYYEQSKRGERS